MITVEKGTIIGVVLSILFFCSSIIVHIVPVVAPWILLALKIVAILLHALFVYLAASDPNEKLSVLVISLILFATLVSLHLISKS